MSSTASDTAKGLSNHKDLYLWHTGSVYTNIFMHTLRIYLAEKQDKMPTVNGSAGFTSTKRRRFCLMRKFGVIYFNMSVCMHGGGSISRSLPFAPITETPGNSKFIQASSLTIGTLAFITTGTSSLTSTTSNLFPFGAETVSWNWYVQETSMMHSLCGATIRPAGLHELFKLRLLQCGHVVDTTLLRFQYLDKKGAVACFDEVEVGVVVVVF